MINSVQYWHSPFGLFRIEATAKGIRSIQPADTLGNESPSLLTEQCVAELDQFVSGDRTQFDVPLDVEGTDFQCAVWNQAQKLPFGAKVTYAELADMTGRPKASRAVGNALNRNPIPFIIPCHRIIPKGKGIGGFAFGANIKEQLLTLEAKAA